MKTGLPDDVRQEAFEYVDAVLARAEGKGGAAADLGVKVQRRPVLARVMPRFVKRAAVKFLVYLMRHPFDHLAHPLQIRLEEEIGQSRGIAHAALTRAEHTASEVRRLRAELSRQRPSQ